MDRRKLILTAASVTGLATMAGWYWPRRWKYIVVHHSAGNYGDIRFLQKVHRERQARDPVDAIPYHFIIGNGNGLGMGEVASDWRQDWHLWGAHVSGRNPDRNFRGIGICLIGNFESKPVPEPQYQALVKLTTRLMQEFSISVENVSGHGHTQGESTKCPGKHFPMQAFIRDIS